MQRSTLATPTKKQPILLNSSSNTQIKKIKAPLDPNSKVPKSTIKSPRNQLVQGVGATTPIQHGE